MGGWVSGRVGRTGSCPCCPATMYLIGGMRQHLLSGLQARARGMQSCPIADMGLS